MDCSPATAEKFRIIENIFDTKILKRDKETDAKNYASFGMTHQNSTTTMYY